MSKLYERLVQGAMGWAFDHGMMDEERYRNMRARFQKKLERKVKDRTVSLLVRVKLLEAELDVLRARAGLRAEIEVPTTPEATKQAPVA